MRVPFTKMQGAGNDFVVLDETRQPLGLGAAQYRFLADRHFGVGADQILTVRPSPAPGIDFEYVIHNADGGQVEQCGNGARCFARFVRDRRLTDKDTIRVQTLGGVIEPRIMADGRVRVDMGAPAFDPAAVAFDTQGLAPQALGGAQQWPLALTADGAPLWLILVSKGNPHAVQWVPDVDAAPVAQTGPLIESHPRFARRVNAGFGQIVNRRTLRLRVFERGVGETLACGSGACAAAAVLIRRGVVDRSVTIELPGGDLHIRWSDDGAEVIMSGPAAFVFEGEWDA